MTGGAWAEPEQRGRVLVTTFLTEVPAGQVLVVLLRPEGNGTVEEVIGEYAQDLGRRLSEGWRLSAMTMYPIGHRAGAGYPGMSLDMGLVVATYQRAPTQAG